MILALLLSQFGNPPGQPAFPHPLNGILNGNFEHLHPGTSIDGGFWVGGEGRTLTELSGSNRFLRIPAGSDDIAYQRVGVAPDRTKTATLGARVRVALAGDEARLTLSEGDRSHDSLAWTFQSGAICGANQWEFFEEWPGAPGVPVPMATRVCSPFVLPVVSANGTSNTCSWNEVNVSPDAPLLVVWRAPEAGTVRIIVRPWRATVSTLPVQQEILFDTNDINTAPPPTSIRIDQLAGSDVDGPIILERHGVAVGNRIVFRLSQPAGSQSTARVMMYPTISYEGRRLTYRFGTSLTSGNAPPNPYVNKTVTIGAWTSFSSLNAATDFAAAHGSPPRGPLDVELSCRTTNSNRVDFDDIQCVTKTDDVTAGSLRDLILAEARWARDSWRKVRDRVSAGGRWTLGAVESPYWAHSMRVVSGPQQRTCGTFIGQAPPGLWELLDRVYDDQDYEDFFRMREQEVQNLSPIGLPYSAYECCSDQYLTGAANYPSGVGASFNADLYERTNDPTLLDRGFAAADLLATRGVIGSPGAHDPAPPPAGARDGLIWAGNYDIDSGALLYIQDPVTNGWISPSLTNWGQLGPPTTILRAYVECKKFNAAHPGIAPPRYDPAKLDGMLAAAHAAVVKAIDFKWWASPGMHHTWGGLWHAIFGSFNDNFGYMSSNAWPAYEALVSLSSPTTLEAQTRDLLRDEILLSGCDNFLPLWEQASSRNDMNAGDSPRAWPAYLRMIGVSDLDPTNPNPNRNRYANQLVTAAFACVNFQYRAGVWTMAGQDPFQLINQAGGFGGGKRAVEQFFLGMSTALAVPSPNLSAARKVDLMTEMYEMQRTNQAYYKPPFDPTYPDGPYGYYDRFDYPPGHDNFAGAEWRTIVSLLESLDTLDEGLPDAPGATVLSPTNLRTPPVGGQTVIFRFQIQVPTAVTTADLALALTDRTKIDLWSYPGGGAMAVQTNLWPTSPLSFSTPVYDTTATPKTATISYLVPQGAGAGDFKFTIRTWDPDGQWDRDTSYQENW